MEGGLLEVEKLRNDSLFDDGGDGRNLGSGVEPVEGAGLMKENLLVQLHIATGARLRTCWIVLARAALARSPFFRKELMVC